MDHKHFITDEEQSIVEQLGDVWNKFLKLPVEHGDDIRDFRYGIHTLQRQILARPARRSMLTDTSK